MAIASPPRTQGMEPAMTTITPAWASQTRRYRRFLGAGAGIGGLSSFTTWMSRYQVYFIAASIAVMALRLARVIRRNGAAQGARAAARQISRQVLTMAAVYLVTLLAGMAAAASSAHGEPDRR
jgi:hypothetical protein